MKGFVRTLAGGFSLLLAAGANAFVYKYDDGTSDDGLGSSGPAFYNAGYVLNFTVQEFATTIISLSAVWGISTIPSLPNGLSADVFLMTDPNGDMNPSDGVVLQSVAATTENVGSDIYSTYAITPTHFSVGEKFFVGVFIRDIPSGSAWCPFDENAVGASQFGWWNWQISGPTGPYEPVSVWGPDHGLMLRADAVPEPGTLMVTGLGLAILVRRRRSWNKNT